MAYLHEGRPLVVHTPLGPDALSLSAVRGREAVSELFSFQLEMLSQDHAIQPEALIGRPIGFGMRMADGRMRRVHGRIARFWVGWTRPDGLRGYRAEVEPWFAFLRHAVDSRVYRNMSVPEIARSIFERFDLTDIDTSDLREPHAALESSAQYQESCYDYLCRLFEDEGIFFFFRHEKDRHVLVLADANAAFQDAAETDLPYDPDLERLGVLNRWEHAYAFLPLKLAASDYNPQAPTAALDLERPTLMRQLPKADRFPFERYEWPGGFSTRDAGETVMRRRLEEVEIGFHRIEGASTCPGLEAGGRIRLAEHPDRREKGRAYYLLSVEHEARDDSLTTVDEGGAGGTSYRYANRFTATPAVSRVSGMERPYRPARTTPKPRIHGAQTAVVVGPEGETIHCDNQGRVKIQFHWDRHGRHDDTSSCWVRVSREWAGKSFGSTRLPHVGQEVLVSFLEGDPDRPLIVGRVHNAGQKDPLVADAIARKTQTLLRDQGGNHILTEGGSKAERIELHSPSGDSHFEMGAVHRPHPAAAMMARFQAAFPGGVPLADKFAAAPASLAPISLAFSPAAGAAPSAGPSGADETTLWNGFIKSTEGQSVTSYGNTCWISASDDTWSSYQGDVISLYEGNVYSSQQGDYYQWNYGNYLSEVTGDTTEYYNGNYVEYVKGNYTQIDYGTTESLFLGEVSNLYSLLTTNWYVGATMNLCLGHVTNITIGAALTINLNRERKMAVAYKEYNLESRKWIAKDATFCLDKNKVAALEERLSSVQNNNQLVLAENNLEESRSTVVAQRTSGLLMEESGSQLNNAPISVNDGMIMNL